MRIFCLFVFVEPEGISADVPNSSLLSKPDIPPFLFLHSFYRSYQTELWKTLRSVELCQLLSTPPRRKTGAENKSNRSRPVEQGDTARVDVTSCFIVWVCVQLNRDWTWKKAHSNTGLLFFFPGESQEIRCTFQATQSRTDERGREQGAAQTGVKLIFRQNKTELWISEQWKTRQRRAEQCSSHSH